jgi:hypothetical protein
MLFRIFTCALLALLALPRYATAHDIPNDVTIQAFLKPEGQRLRLLVRVPMKAMRDVVFPERGMFLDLARIDPLLHDAAQVWISDNIQLEEGDRRLPKPAIADTRVLPEAIERTAERLRPILERLAVPKEKGRLLTQPDIRLLLDYLQHPVMFRLLMPQVVVIDRKGIIRTQLAGDDKFFDKAEQEKNFREVLEPLLKEGTAKPLAREKKRK